MKKHDIRDAGKSSRATVPPTAAAPSSTPSPAAT